MFALFRLGLKGILVCGFFAAIAVQIIAHYDIYSKKAKEESLLLSDNSAPSLKKINGGAVPSMNLLREGTGNSLSARYEKSFVSNFINRRYFFRVASNYPGTASFVVGLDPHASKLARQRWIVIAMVGYMHFCFFSPWSKRLRAYGISGWMLFFSPFGLALFPGIVMLTGFIVRLFNPALEKYFAQLAGFLSSALAALILLVSVLSIPLTLIMAGYRLCRMSVRVAAGIFCELWLFGERVFGVPKRKLTLAISRFVIRKKASLRDRDRRCTAIQQDYNRNESHRNQINNKAGMPGPIVRRIELNGVTYDI